MLVAAVYARGAQSMDVEISEQDGVVIIRYHNVVIDSVEAFERWESILTPQLDALFRERGRLLIAVCTEGLTLERRLGPQYSSLAERVAEEYAAGIARFGARSRTNAVIAVEAMNRLRKGCHGANKEHYGANVFEDQDAAIQFLRSLG